MWAVGGQSPEDSGVLVTDRWVLAKQEAPGDRGEVTGRSREESQGGPRGRPSGGHSVQVCLGPPRVGEQLGPSGREVGNSEETIQGSF